MVKVEKFKVFASIDKWNLLCIIAWHAIWILLWKSVPSRKRWNQWALTKGWRFQNPFFKFSQWVKCIAYHLLLLAGSLLKIRGTFNGCQIHTIRVLLNSIPPQEIKLKLQSGFGISKDIYLLGWWYEAFNDFGDMDQHSFCQEVWQRLQDYWN